MHFRNVMSPACFFPDGHPCPTNDLLGDIAHAPDPIPTRVPTTETATISITCPNVFDFIQGKWPQAVCVPDYIDNYEYMYFMLIGNSKEINLSSIWIWNFVSQFINLELYYNHCDPFCWIEIEVGLKQSIMDHISFFQVMIRLPGHLLSRWRAPQNSKGLLSM